MYIYFGYFSAGHSVYSIFTEHEIPLEFIKLKKVPNYTGTTHIFKPTICLPFDEDYRVYNLKTGNDWWWKGDGTKGLTLCNPFNTPSVYNVHEFLSENKLDIHDMVNIGEIDNLLRGNNTAGADDVIQEKTKEENYPDLIIGNNIPKIKLDKEFNYVGKVNFEPFPKRDHGDVGQ